MEIAPGTFNAIIGASGSGKSTLLNIIGTLDLMGLSKVANNNVTKMSGGQQQRTAIARSLINSPKIILADEPTGNLDSESTETVYDILRDINETFQTAFLIITHDRRIAQKTDRIIEITDGKIALDVRNKAPKKEKTDAAGA